jgi:hypothetical protein
MKDKITVNGNGCTRELHLTSAMWNRFGHVMTRELLENLQDKFSVPVKAEIDMHSGFNYKLHIAADRPVIDAVAEEVLARFAPPKLEKIDAAQGWQFNIIEDEMILFSPKGQECDGFLEWYDVKLLETALHQCGIAFEAEDDGEEPIANLFELQEDDLDKEQLIHDLQTIGFEYAPQLKYSPVVHQRLFGR